MSAGDMGPRGPNPNKTWRERIKLRRRKIKAELERLETDANRLNDRDRARELRTLIDKMERDEV
jgi:hypothetical protein